MNRNLLKAKLKTYQTEFEEEKEFIPQFLLLLKEENAFIRKNLSDHFTGSAWIVSDDYRKVILVHHVKLEKWLQPGGHADGNENIWEVTRKEAWEETGIEKLKSFNDEFFDLDIHPIPAYKDIPAHYHYDFRFLFVASKDAILRKTVESNAVEWIDLNEVNNLTTNNKSIKRMVNKTKKMIERRL